MTVIHLNETISTNQWLRDYGGNEDMTVWADYQTAGRGCGTNSWESERGQNLLFSLLLHPKGVPAASQFILSMANALALRDALAEQIDDVTIKWPNDIYWHDQKICGTLIETTLRSSGIATCIIGTGINVNQQQFLSDAPNPVSLRQILGHDTDREELLHRVLSHIARKMDEVELGAWEPIRAHYRQHLYRRGETHDYLIDGKREKCELTGVTDDGHLQLLLLSGQGKEDRLLSFAFKEVQFIL